MWRGSTHNRRPRNLDRKVLGGQEVGGTKSIRKCSEAAQKAKEVMSERPGEGMGDRVSPGGTYKLFAFTY